MKLFGTDGIRGKVGEFPITPSGMEKLGYAISKAIFKDKEGLVLISDDGRASATEIETALRRGISKQGSAITSLNLLSTPALSYVVHHLELLDTSNPIHIGIQITASHNHYKDNGIKVFDTNGLKLSEEKEQEIEDIFNNLDEISTDVEVIWKETSVKGITALEANAEYNGSTKKYFQNKVKKVNDRKFLVMIDCANGATSEHVQNIFEDSHGIGDGR